MTTLDEYKAVLTADLATLNEQARGTEDYFKGEVKVSYDEKGNETAEAALLIYWQGHGPDESVYLEAAPKAQHYKHHLWEWEWRRCQLSLKLNGRQIVSFEDTISGGMNDGEEAANLLEATTLRDLWELAALRIAESEEMGPDYADWLIEQSHEELSPIPYDELLLPDDLETRDHLYGALYNELRKQNRPHNYND
jgi:hypothetical protein